MPRSEHTLAQSKAVRYELAGFASLVSSYRETHGLSRRALAEKVGCSESNIKNIETGESAPSFAVYVTLRNLIAK